MKIQYQKRPFQSGDSVQCTNIEGMDSLLRADCRYTLDSCHGGEYLYVSEFPDRPLRADRFAPLNKPADNDPKYKPAHKFTSTDRFTLNDHWQYMELRDAGEVITVDEDAGSADVVMDEGAEVTIPLYVMTLETGDYRIVDLGHVSKQSYPTEREAFDAAEEQGHREFHIVRLSHVAHYSDVLSGLSPAEAAAVAADPLALL